MSRSPLPLPRWTDADVAVEPPGPGAGHWAGAPSAVLVDDAFHLAYRVRAPLGEGRGLAVVLGISDDGVAVTGLAHFDGSGFLADGQRAVAESPHGAHGLRYLAVVALPGGGYRLYYEATRADGAHELRTELPHASVPAGVG